MNTEDLSLSLLSAIAMKVGTIRHPDMSSYTRRDITIIISAKRGAPTAKDQKYLRCRFQSWKHRIWTDQPWRPRL